VQGRFGAGPHFLITAPITLYSQAEFVADLSLDHVTVEPAHCVKSLRAVKQYLESQDLPVSGSLRVLTGAQHSLGFGTSTADITSSLRAAAGAWQRTVGPEEVSRIAAAMEPTDGSMYPGSVAYAHREGRLLEILGPLPRFRALVSICGEAVDTVAFDARRAHFQYSADDERKLRTAWQMVREAIRSADVGLMAEAGTMSAEVNEVLLPKPMFNDIRQSVQPLGAEGLLVAHSGSLVALILDPDRPDYEKRRDRLGRFMDDLGMPCWLEVASY
jgi:L-threonine kinase